MSKVYETGHAKNVANFKTLLTYVSGYGSAYNPSRTSIQLPNLSNKASQATDVMSSLNSLLPNYSNAVAAREVAFEPLQKLSTRIFNALKATDVSAQVVGNAKTNHLKITGRRASIKLSEEDKLAAIAAGSEVHQVSPSQQSYDSILNSFDKQIKLLASIPEYAPNENELKIATLQAIYTDLQEKNIIVIKHQSTLSKARILRNEVMYHPETGMVATATDVKNYLKSVFGATNANYKQVSGLAFRTVKS